ncbi:extensin-2-like, partial [Astyanax mexicanus]
MTRNKFILLMISAMLWSFVFSHETDQTTDYPSEFSPRTVQIGRLFVRIGAEGEGNLQNGLPDDAEGHPSDSQATAGSYKTAETKLQLLNPSVHCGGDSMALHIQGYRLPNFMVDRGGEGVIPVTQLPDNCGISTKRVHRVFLVIVQYEGCDVKQQGDDYVLPLRLWGAPVSMSCPVSSTNVTADQPAGPTEALTPARSIDASTASTVPASDSRPNRYNFGWDNFQPYRHFWPGHTGTPTGAPAPAPSTEASTPASTTAASTAQAVPASDPQQDLYPFGSFPYQHQYPFYPNRYFWPGHIGAPTGAPAPAPSTAASTGQAVPASDPQTNWNRIPYSQGWNPFYPYRHFWPGHMGVPTATPPPASTTRAPTPASTTRAPTPASTTRAPTPASTTGAPTSAPPTAASTAQAVPASDPQQDLYPFGSFPYQYPFYPNRYFWPGLTGAPTGAPAPSTAASTGQAVPAIPASDPQTNWNRIPYSQGWNPFYPYRHFWPGHMGVPTATPPPASITGAPRPASTTGAPTSAPSTAASTAQAVPASDPASDPQQDLYPFGSFPYQYPFYPNRYFWPGLTGAPTGAPAPAPSTAASTGQSVPASDPQTNWNQIPYSQGWNPFYPYRYFWPGHV